MTSPIFLPPGFELEQDDASGIKLPPGYELEQSDSPSINLPPGFQLEQGSSAPQVKLPPGFVLEHGIPTAHAAPQSGNRLQQPFRELGVQAPEYPGIRRLSAPVRPKSRPNAAASVPRTSPSLSAAQTNQSNPDADTRKFFEDAYSRFFDSGQSQSSSQNLPSTGQVGTHRGDRSWANAPPEVIARVHPPQAGKSTAPPGSVQNPAQRPGAISRFTDNMGQAMGVPPVMSDYWEGPKIAVTHPIESAKLLTEAGNQAEQDLIDKAYWYQHEPGFGNKVKGLGYGIYSLIPFAGSSLAHAGEQFEQGDFAGGFGTTLGVAGPSLLGAKGSVHEPGFGFTPGDSVVLPNGRSGTVQKIFPRMGVARVETESGPRTERLSRLQPADAAVVDPAAPAQASTELSPLQLHPGDRVVLPNGRNARVLVVFPEMGAARVVTGQGKTRTVRLWEIRKQEAARAARALKSDNSQLVLFEDNQAPESRPTNVQQVKTRKNRTPSESNPDLDHARTTHNMDGSTTYYDLAGRSVTYTKAGHPDFSEHGELKITVHVKGLKGKNPPDDQLANMAAGLKSTPKGYTWHHLEVGKTMRLVPTDIHETFPHTGGASVIKSRKGRR